jgi:hypothetical protein
MKNGSDLSGVISRLRLPDHSLVKIVGERSDEIARVDPKKHLKLLERLASDNDFFDAAKRAASDGVVYCSLALMLLSDEEFDHALELMPQSTDPMIEDLRSAVFFEALRDCERDAACCGVSTVSLRARADRFRECIALQARA